MTVIKTTSDVTVRLVQQTGGDHMVVAAAKVSVSGEQAVQYAYVPAEENFGLINFLMKHRHGTPFEHSFLTFFVHAPMFVWWEWVRHRIGHSYNLESSRYNQLDPVFWVPRRTRKMVPSPEHKSAHPDFLEADEPHYDATVEILRAAYQTAYDQYEDLLGGGLAKEVARVILPPGVYFSGWVSVNPRSLMAFLSLRTKDETATFPSYPQAEIEEAARQCEALLKEGWPLTHRAFCENGRVAP